MFKDHDSSPKGVEIGSWEAKQQQEQQQNNNKNNNKTNSFNGGSTDTDALHKQIHSMSVVLKSNRGAIREKYQEWLLRAHGKRLRNTALLCVVHLG